jgi:hypothetical protein
MKWHKFYRSWTIDRFSPSTLCVGKLIINLNPYFIFLNNSCIFQAGIGGRRVHKHGADGSHRQQMRAIWCSTWITRACTPSCTCSEWAAHKRLGCMFLVTVFCLRFNYEVCLPYLRNIFIVSTTFRIIDKLFVLLLFLSATKYFS